MMVLLLRFQVVGGWTAAEGIGVVEVLNDFDQVVAAYHFDGGDAQQREAALACAHRHAVELEGGIAAAHRDGPLL